MWLVAALEQCVCDSEAALLEESSRSQAMLRGDRGAG